MKKNTLAWVVIAGVGIAFSGMGMAACSSSSTTGEPSTGTDASGGGDGQQQSDGGNNDGGNPSDSGTGSECGTIPTLHKTVAPDGGGEDIFCFTTGLYCATGTQACCIPEFGASGNPACTDAGTACPTQNLNIQCDDDTACTGGKKCCAQGTPGLTTTAGCTEYEKIYGFTGTVCADSCAGLGEDGGTGTEVCSETTGCSDSSKTCTPAKEYVQIGLCL